MLKALLVATVCKLDSVVRSGFPGAYPLLQLCGPFHLPSSHKGIILDIFQVAFAYVVPLHSQMQWPGKQRSIRNKGIFWSLGLR